MSAPEWRWLYELLKGIDGPRTGGVMDRMPRTDQEIQQAEEEFAAEFRAQLGIDEAEAEAEAEIG